MAQHYKNEEITKSRINVFLGWENFNAKGNVAPGRMDQNLCGRLWTPINTSCISISVASPAQLIGELTASSLEQLDFKPANVGESFGPTFTTHVFRLDILVPNDLHGVPVHLLWDSNSEAMVFDEHGVPRQGLVGGDHWARRADYVLFGGRPGHRAVGGEKLRIYVEISCNGLFGAGRGGEIEPPDMNRTYKIDQCCLAKFDPNAWALIHDVTMLQGLAKHLPDIPRRKEALHVANRVINAVDVADPKTYKAGLEIAASFLSVKNGKSQSVVYSMLHSHIDLAWLWPMAVTPAKGARTFSNILRLMESYPECVFVQSQAQLYQWVKDDYPALWKQIVNRVEEGRFIPVGGTWVEMDCNIPCGESLVRQFVYGQRFFLENFGIRCKEFWLPDTFGYAAQLPQIMKGCAVDYFMTQKLSWNVFNKFPHSTFVWEGLDGSRVVAHMPPANTYNSQAFPEEVIMSAHKNKDAPVFNKSILLVGHGDGGGGPSPAMLESLARMNDVDGCPRVEFSTPKTFFDQAARVADELPRWVGELYFELHRGTYTTQAKTKQLNRYCEMLLRDVEVLSTLCTVSSSDKSGEEFKYPQEVLDEMWKIVLKNCFHDTLPGSSIALVYEETTHDYRKVVDVCHREIKRAADFIEKHAIQKATNGFSGHMALDAHSTSNVETTAVISADGVREIASETVKQRAPPLFVRGPSWETSTKGTGAVKRVYIMAVDEALQVERKDTISQKVLCPSFDWRRNSAEWLKRPLPLSRPQKLVALCHRPSGFGVDNMPDVLSKEGFSSHSAAAEIGEVIGEDGDIEFELINANVHATITKQGRVRSLKLSCGRTWRDILVHPTDSNEQEAGGNRLVLYDDVPMFWDGWDTEIYAFEKPTHVCEATECQIVERGPLRVGLKIIYRPTEAGTTITQFVTLRAESHRLDFFTEIDWCERRKILRAEFNTVIRSNNASYDAQFGYVRRPTTFNHSWEVAKFESVAHQFCDLSECGLGVAMMSDSKYGYSVRDSKMRISLLRAPKSPDDNADLGKQVMTYAVLPHLGGFPNKEVFEEAVDLNSPPIVNFMPDPATGSVVRCLGDGQTFMHNLVFCVAKATTPDEIDTVAITAVKRCDSRKEHIVLRLHECFGSRGTAHIRLPPGLNVDQVADCDMLEQVVCEDRKPVFCLDSMLKVVFLPFEIRTVAITPHIG